MTTRAPGLGSVLSDVLGNVVNSAENQATTWLIQQYATLRASPNRLTALATAQRTLLARVQPGSPDGASDDLSRTIDAGTTLQGLTAGYPGLMQQVDSAYQAVNRDVAQADPATALLGDSALIAGAVVGAQQFLAGVATVDAELKAVIDHMLSTGALTPTEATSIYASAQSNTAGWGKYVLYAAIGLAALWLLPKLIRSATR